MKGGRRKYRWLWITLAVILGSKLLVFLGIWGWAEYHYQSARSATRRYDLTIAREHAEKSLDIWSRRGTTYLLLARIARLDGDFQEAEKYLSLYEKNLGSDDDHLREEAMLRAQAGALDVSEAYLRDLVEDKDPDSPLILEALTEGYMRVYRSQEAFLCIKIWLEEDPENPRAHLWKGKLRERQHRYKEARQDYEKAIRFAPEQFEPRFRLACTLIELGEPKKAVPILEKLYSERPDDTDVLVRLAFCLNHMGKIDRGRKLLQQILAKQPNYAPALTGMAQIELRADNPAKAEQWLLKTLKITPFDRLPNFLLFEAYRRQSGKAQLAKQQDIRVKKIEKRLTRVIEIGNREMSERPNDPKLHFEIGVLCLQLGREKEGVGWLLSTLQLNKSHAQAHIALARHFEQTGDNSRAEYHRRQAKSLGSQ